MFRELADYVKVIKKQQLDFITENPVPALIRADAESPEKKRNLVLLTFIQIRERLEMMETLEGHLSEDSIRRILYELSGLYHVLQGSLSPKFWNVLRKRILNEDSMGPTRLWNVPELALEHSARRFYASLLRAIKKVETRIVANDEFYYDILFEVAIKAYVNLVRLRTEQVDVSS